MDFKEYKNPNFWELRRRADRRMKRLEAAIVYVSVPILILGGYAFVGMVEHL